MESYRCPDGRPRHRVLLALGPAESVEGALIDALADKALAERRAQMFQKRASEKRVECMKLIERQLAYKRLWGRAESDERYAEDAMKRARRYDERIAEIRRFLTDEAAADWDKLAAVEVERRVAAEGERDERIKAAMAATVVT